MKNIFRAALLIGCLSSIIHADPIPVWPDLDPALKSAEKPNDRGDAQRPNRFVTDVQYPTLEVFPADPAKPTPAIVICPGGGYRGVAMDKEGYEVAKWLNSVGITGVVLKYRMPHGEAGQGQTPLPLLDAREALKLTRQHAEEWHVDPKHVGIIGFSAGGHLAATVATKPADDPAARADFAILGYPVISMKEGLTHKGSRDNLLGHDPNPQTVDDYSADLHVTKETVPTFVFCAADDKGVKPATNALPLVAAYTTAGAPVELHLFPKGGHGFGLAVEGGPAKQWPALCEKWLESLLSKN